MAQFPKDNLTQMEAILNQRKQIEETEGRAALSITVPTPVEVVPASDTNGNGVVNPLTLPPPRELLEKLYGKPKLPMSVQTIVDPTSVVASLDSVAILKRLEELEGEERALRVLLRAAQAKERKAKREKPKTE